MPSLASMQLILSLSMALTWPTTPPILLKPCKWKWAMPCGAPARRVLRRTGVIPTRLRTATSCCKSPLLRRASLRVFTWPTRLTTLQRTLSERPPPPAQDKAPTTRLPTIPLKAVARASCCWGWWISRPTPTTTRTTTLAAAPAAPREWGAQGAATCCEI